MPTVDLVMPKMGESIMEATILKWHKNPGDAVKMDETLLEIATDKVDSEVPSTAEGVLSEVLFSVNDVVPIGTVIARIRTEAAGESTAASYQQPAAHQNNGQGITNNELKAEPERREQSAANFNPPSPAPNSGARFYSPLVLNIAAQEGVSMSELENIPGTGNEGRVTKKDILQYVSDKKRGRSGS